MYTVPYLETVSSAVWTGRAISRERERQEKQLSIHVGMHHDYGMSNYTQSPSQAPPPPPPPPPPQPAGYKYFLIHTAPINSKLLVRMSSINFLIPVLPNVHVYLILIPSSLGFANGHTRVCSFVNHLKEKRV